MKQSITIKRLIALTTLLFTTMLLLLNPLTALAAPVSQGTVHVVRRGETLSGIAAQYGVSMSEIMQTNGIRNANRIQVGQRLTIPARSSRTTSTSSAASTGITSNTGGTSGVCYTHTIRWGDTLSSIARHYGVTVESIKQANGLFSFLIFPGRRLKIPCTRTFLPSVTSHPTPALASGVRGCLLTSGKYQVQRGDTLSNIARRCGTSVSAIQAANGLSGTKIYVGRWLVIPTGRVTPVPQPTATRILVAVSTKAPSWQPTVVSITPTPTPTPTRVPVRSTKVPTYTPTPTM